MSLRRLSQAVGIDERRVKDACEMLEEDRLIKKISLPTGSAVFYKITARGIGFVEKYMNTQESLSTTLR